MRFAYLIAAHRSLEQLRCLVARLLREDPGDIVVLHVDARSRITDADIAAIQRAHPQSRILATRRIDSRWGHPSLCEVISLLIGGLEGLDYDYAHLLSGQDWPIMGKPEMVDSIQKGTCHIGITGKPRARWMDGFHFHNALLSPHETYGVPRRVQRRLLGFAGSLWTKLGTVFGTGRSCPLGPEWKKGEAWWSLPRAAVDWLRPRLAEILLSGRIKYTLCSDEQVVQTILAYSPFAGAIEDDRRFIIRPGGWSPAMLTRDDLPAMRASGDWFARKCDIAHDPFFLAL